MRDKRNATYLDAFNAFVKSLVPKGRRRFTADSETEILGIFRKLEAAAIEKRIIANFHYWDHGWHKFHNLREKNGEIIAFNDYPGMVPHLLGRPLHAFAAYHFPEDPDFNFMRFSYRGLSQEGVNELSDEQIRSLHREEYVELACGEAISRSCWDEGFKGHDEDGYEEPFEEGDRPVVRELMNGSFFVCSIGSAFNDTRLENNMIQILNFGEDCDAYRGLMEYFKHENKK